MDLHIQYNTPSRNDICVAFAFFNTCGYVRILQNLLFFENKLKLAKIPYFVAEMVIGDQPPMIANPTIRFYCKSSLFYKEALWNRLEKEIPAQFTKICFLDADIIFNKSSWLDDISRLLDSYDVIHCFNKVNMLDLSYAIERTYDSPIINRSSPQVGFGWAIQRPIFKKIGGFFDMGFLGASDRIFYECLTNKLRDKTDAVYSLIYEYVLEYYSNLQSYNITYSCSNSTIYHLSHGTEKNRNYSNRELILNSISNMEFKDVFQLNTDGFWEPIDSELNNKLYSYFSERKEDLDCVDTDDYFKPHLHIPYSIPRKTDICVAICYFNSYGYIRSLQNLLFIQNKLDLAGIPYYTAEMVIGRNSPYISNATIRFHSNSHLFYKEALWNHLEGSIPEQYTKICFLDSDVIFDRDNWLDNLSELLDRYDLVHPYSQIHYLNLSYNLLYSTESIIKNSKTCSAGFGWAMNRSTFIKIGGFFEKCILGGGDSQFYGALINNTKGYSYYRCISDEYAAYASHVQSLNLRYTYLYNHTIYHLYHGSIRNRQYNNRYQRIDKYTDWNSMCIKNDDGFWEVKDNDLNKQLLLYFIDRCEDIAPRSKEYPANDFNQTNVSTLSDPSTYTLSVLEPNIDNAFKKELKDHINEVIHTTIYTSIHKLIPNKLNMELKYLMETISRDMRDLIKNEVNTNSTRKIDQLHTELKSIRSNSYSSTISGSSKNQLNQLNSYKESVAIPGVLGPSLLQRFQKTQNVEYTRSSNARQF
jgi:hypothetical protein